MIWLVWLVGFAVGAEERDAIEAAVEEPFRAHEAVEQGPSGDLNVLAPSLRRVRSGQAEVAAHVGALGYAGGTFTSSFDGVAPVSAVRAGIAPLDHLWVDVRAGYGAPVDELDVGVGLVYGTASYAVVDTPRLRTGPSLATGFLGADTAVPFGAAGWSVVAAPVDAVAFDLSLYGFTAPGTVDAPVLPYGEAGVTLRPDGSPHSVRLGVAALVPTAAYRFEEEHWFLQIHATGLLLPGVVVAESGVEVGAHF